ncbi:MAG: tRNA adenosine(34) deaminase TadA [Acidimicrobiales bacterium]
MTEPMSDAVPPAGAPTDEVPASQAATWFGVTDEHERVMRLAMAEAARALEHGDVPVGALVFQGEALISSRHNERELTGDPTAHAEVLALRDAAERLGRWRLDDCTLVVTLEPCLMCAGALLNARVASVIYGAADMKAGACLSLYNVGDDPRLNHRIDIVPGVLEAECAELLTSFFAPHR